MPTPERRSAFPKATNEPLPSTPLPDAVGSLLQDRPSEALFYAIEKLGTVVIAKAPVSETQSLVEPLPVEIDQRLFPHRNAPVLRTAIIFHDVPETALHFVIFSNVADPRQRDDLTALAQQKALHILFYDEDLKHRLTKRVRLTSPGMIRSHLMEAEEQLRKMKPGHFDFVRAKQEVSATFRR